ncbi:MAG: phospholipase [Candidatus Riflebacteria bacterium]|nr:phospholipase [Candidatus Riflebacteria bacterium]
MAALAEGLETGRLQPPLSPGALAGFARDADTARAAATLGKLMQAAGSTSALAAVLRVAAAEREDAQHLADRVELVWTGPEERGMASRDTFVVLRELFAAAERSVLLTCYAISNGPRVFAALAERMDRLSGLTVRMFLNVAHPPHETATDAELLRRFAETFRREQWPGERLPEVFYDPLALAAGPGPRACLHAKCVVVDARRAFVTSANFTEAAQERNLEVGVLVDDPVLARSLESQFEALVTAGVLKRVPGLGT